LFIIQVGFPAFLGESDWIVILMTMDAAYFKGVSLGIIDLGFGFPIEAFRIFKPFGVNITCTCFGFFHQVTFPMRGQMAVYAMDTYASLIVVVGREFPALGGMRMDVAGSAIIISGCEYNRFVSKENKQCGHNCSGQEEDPAPFFTFLSHNQNR
jgi:hypothetical protein